MHTKQGRGERARGCGSWDRGDPGRESRTKAQGERKGSKSNKSSERPAVVVFRVASDSWMGVVRSRKREPDKDKEEKTNKKQSKENKTVSGR